MTADTTSIPRPMLEYQLEHICSYTVNLAMPPEVAGPAPSDLRINAHHAGGEIWGPVCAAGSCRSVRTG